MSGAAIVPEIVAEFPEQFAAAEALRDFAKANRPEAAPTPDEAGVLILRTYARSSKTYNGSLRASVRRLWSAGWHAQSLALRGHDRRALHPANAETAPEMFDRHRQYAFDQIREKYAKNGRQEEITTWPPLTDVERVELAAEYGRKHHWTQRSLYELVKDIESDWPDESTDRRMLWQVFDITHRFNNLVLHHSFFGLGLTAETNESGIRWDVGPSPTHIHAALLGAWFSYVHTVRLVVSGDALDELTQLFNENLPAFTSIREVERGDGDGKTLESSEGKGSGGFERCPGRTIASRCGVSRARPPRARSPAIRTSAGRASLPLRGSETA